MVVENLRNVQSVFIKGFSEICGTIRTRSGKNPIIRKTFEHWGQQKTLTITKTSLHFGAAESMANTSGGNVLGKVVLDVLSFVYPSMPLLQSLVHVPKHSFSQPLTSKHCRSIATWFATIHIAVPNLFDQKPAPGQLPRRNQCAAGAEDHPHDKLHQASCPSSVNSLCLNCESKDSLFSRL